MEASATQINARPQLWRATIASVIGNGLEWYDFILYGFFAAIISQTFFPSSSRFLSLMLSLATFAIGFLVRPLGGIVLGLYADHFGRKRALTLLILLMAGSTVAVGIIPGYATIGLAAPLLIVLARLVQGLSVGGEFASATAMLVEYVPPNRKMFYGSLQMVSQSVAVTIASLAGFITTAVLPHPALMAWGWRLPFLLGILVGPVGFYIRRRVEESPEFAMLAAHTNVVRTSTPFRTVLRDHRAAVLSGIGLIVVGTGATYLWNTYLPIYVTRQLHMPMASAMIGITICGAISTCMIPFIGKLSDRIGPYRIYLTAVVVFGLISWPLFAYVTAHPDRARLLEAQIVANVLLAFMAAGIPGMIAGLFPTAVRSTGMALAYNVAVTVFGGLAPLTVTWMIRQFDSQMMPAVYLMIAAALSLVLVGGTRRVWLRGLAPVQAVPAAE
ncbi:MAG TPA: MFS transporter [Acetobacteraceae bacterium]|nr:MFS transporter [Acetobacteraceae bacterium]